MDTIRLPHDFKEFLKLLNSNEVEYLVIGGYAVNYYGYPRATIDLDIWIALNPNNSSRVAKSLREFGFHDVEASLFQEPGKIVRMGVPPLRLELLTVISGVEFDQCYTRRLEATLDGTPIHLIHRDDLVKNKIAAGRDKDQVDVNRLKRFIAANEKGSPPKTPD